MPLPRFLRRLLWVWGGFFAFLVVLLFAGLILPSVVRVPPAGTGTGASTVRLADPSGTVMTLPVERATTPQQQTLGLMHRPTVTTGMLFVFQDEQPRAFWMKDTLVPLDISFFAADGSWVSGARMEPCVADPCATYPSEGPAKYALELPAGGLGAGIGSGWKLTP